MIPKASMLPPGMKPWPASVALGLAALANVAHADIVTDWNETFLRAVRNETTPPGLAARNLAILHVAIYDAVNVITRTHRPYRFQVQSNSEGSIEAAAAAAAHEIAVHLYPSRKAEFDSLLAKGLAAITNDFERTNGVRLGEQAAEAILFWRRDDGASTTVSYIPSAKPGHWRRTPPYFRPPEMPQWRFVKPFAMTNGAQFRPPPPPALDSQRYAADMNEVLRLGGSDSRERTGEQTQIAQFWSDFSYTATPPGHWNSIARVAALDRKLSLEENARLFALLNIALADAAIACWDAKYAYDFWRPVTAIQQADPKWMPLLPTPPFPEYPSGHSTFSGAAAVVLANFFGTDKVDFTVGCDALPGVTRSYHSFQATAEEIGRSRIYGGIHFRTADENGRAVGAALGADVVEQFLRPISPSPMLEPPTSRQR